ncbi:TonB-dependent receptor domain-containing protein [Pseudoalteromonas peptidolytica]|uniref:Vitamin B12 transporter n=1 Tax=Pseudoalteromonas peptidolytica F12-50-A1 TaxID=1315280 RepID=A0A8I0MTC7_9GAMM|nr:TonB-dependent receptor [Pseudoalteromonas peptidolytica]MBE0345058.1 vitamin B12 transporter [Pseudoalteromonas peptidolytica F12-50-A1]NLR14940.1 TonB-dependent receptor [Pseudoalteromonas peptidolytica]GEK09406.1 vitamin B12 transporter BtuB [Pseudoalteromonas peptidolytica]
MLNKTALSAAITAALSFSVFADQNIEHITVTANKFEQPLESALAAISVISRSDIEKSNVQDVVSLLDNVAGIQAVRNGGFGQSVSLFLRGNDAKHTLVLVDGVRVTDANSGDNSLTNIPLNSIERIEIIRGAKAAIYGSDAIAGVINIISREGNHNTITLTSGSHNYSDIEATASYKKDKFTLSANAGYSHTDGYDVIEKDPQVIVGKNHDRDGYYNGNAGLTLQYGDEQSGIFSLRSQYSEGEGEYDAWGSDAYRFHNYTNKLAWKRSSEKLSQHVSYSLGKEQNVQIGSSADDNAYVTKRGQFEYQSQYHISEALSLTGNITFLNEDVGESTATFSESERDNLSVAFGGFYNDENWLAEVVLRTDDYDFHGRANTYTLALGKQVTDGLSVKFNHGSAFRAPSLSQTFVIDSPYYLPNANLSPEEAKNSEIIVTYSDERFRIEAAVYDNRITDKIVYEPNSDWKYVPFNIERADFEGVDLVVEVEDSFGVEHTLNASYVSAKDAKTQQQLQRRARRTLTYTISKTWQDVDATLTLVHRGERNDKVWGAQGSYTVTLPSYTVFNLAANYTFFDRFKLTGRIENLTDKRYFNATAGEAKDGSLLGYKPPGRQAYVGVSYRF